MFPSRTVFDVPQKQKIRELKLQNWAPEKITLKNLKATLRITNNGGNQNLEVAWKKSEFAKLLRFTKNEIVAHEFQNLFKEAFVEFFRYFPSAKNPITTPGQKWRLHRVLFLGKNVMLMESTELEHMGSMFSPKIATKISEINNNDGPAKLVLVEGSIHQKILDAPLSVQVLAGVFPGSIRWVHDLSAGFPRLLEAERVGNIPVSTQRFPIVKTLTHAYKLKVGSLEYFPDASTTK